ncbi:nucleoside-diphosphate sugar epimerase/dehydratase [Pseudoalteromonas sp. MMG024]|uniref:nucleoside-diphosphate sugar epimerase/dehydratase n=1 Tax=Pseudoalteromonas sp. MMG024 TaxID=2909980 RepID=UPI001F2279E7|nr:nucleoside-diphosphate sugar epimerase/dehydratase [Pseudoalteromonas sp. MMG024]MCF6457534.1 polysaccharide biosynthesis protein [Pseudoalteromonas sp. MMG024]
MNSLISFFLQLSRKSKRAITLFIDTLLVTISFWLSIILIQDDIGVLLNKSYWLLLCLFLPIALLGFIKLGLYRAVLRYVSSQALGAILFGTIIATLSLVVVSFMLHISLHRSVPFLFTNFLLVTIGGARISVRAVLGHLQVRRKEPIIIYGAGSAGRQLANALQNGNEMHPVAFVDDDKNKDKTKILGINCFHSTGLQDVIDTWGARKLLLAMPSASLDRRKKILKGLEPLAIKVMSVPSVPEMLAGKNKITDVDDITPDDLLGRAPVDPTPELMAKNIVGKVVMVTGAGGSIGSELCRQIAHQKPKQLILYELSEYALYAIDKELKETVKKLGLKLTITPLLGSVQRKSRLTTVLKSFKVQTLYHAAAYKHVPMVEYNVVEGVRNNVFGTLYTAEAAIEANVETMVLVSTDKAVRPTNVMGATKRLAELVLQALSETQVKTQFCMVRFGNVLGSSGSVVPLFRSQIAKGGPITLTHPEITRYFMTIPEAAQLVIQAGAMGQGGDVFVLDMGESVKIIDLAKQMIHLSGLALKDEDKPYGDIEIQCTGLRPGEKLYEELLIGDNVSGTCHPRIMTALESFLQWNKLLPLLTQLDDACHNFEHDKIRKILLEAPTAFKPTGGISDLVWMQNKSQQPVGEQK